jgi:putative ABC transport system ATP-binding protein
MIALRDVHKVYRTSSHLVHSLRGINLDILAGQFVAVTGPSGSGKSTLMNIIGLLETFDSGSYRLYGHEVSGLTEDQAAQLRNHHVGFVFQSFNLVSRLSAQRNVELPLIYAGVAAHERSRRALYALQQVGLAQRAAHRPSQLSGGQQQRVAIARAIVNNPDLIIADEPTGSLDAQTSREIMAMFQQLNAAGKTIVMVTHDNVVAGYAARVLHLREGEVTMDRTA